MRANGTNLIKVFGGTVTVAGTTTVKVAAGPQIDQPPSWAQREDLLAEGLRTPAAAGLPFAAEG